MNKIILAITFLFVIQASSFSQSKRLRDYGINIGIFKPGLNNSITDVESVKVGHTTLIEDNIRTGVTAILPHDGNIFQSKVPAAIYIGNGFGKLAGYTQVKELGNIETPIILTNTLSVAEATDALITYTLNQPGNENVRSVNSIVGETNDGQLNDIRGRHVKTEDVLNAINNAVSGIVEEGNVGAGTGTICFGFKGGIGTSSRVLPSSLGGYTVGVLVQTNFGGVLEINGVPVGEELNKYSFRGSLDADGSCMIVVATNAPLSDRNLERLAKRSMLGLAKTGGIASNGSGDYVIAFSTASNNFISHSDENNLYKTEVLRNDELSPLFLAVIEATEEAILNSLFAAQTMTGRDGFEVKSIPIKEVIEIMKKYNKIIE
jgi:D-aminopeptidase